MREVEIEAVPPEKLAGLLTPDRGTRFLQVAEYARELLAGRVVWNVNATVSGGGVAEMLQVLLAYGRGAGVDTRWVVLDADRGFFQITKRVHNVLHGEPGDGGALGDAEREHYERVLAANLEAMLAQVSPGDLVLLHDPQTAGLADGLREAGALVVWRCHIGRDTPNELTELGWSFLRQYLEKAHGYVFSRETYPPSWLDRSRMTVIPPSIDPFSLKNQDLSDAVVSAVLRRVGLVDGPRVDQPVTFTRRFGNRGALRSHTGLLIDGAVLPERARLVLQVSRWDRLKDMGGVLSAFADNAGDFAPDVHLVLLGPDVSGVSDDPEGAQVLADCLSLWGSLPRELRERVHLGCVPMDDVDENALIINALQRHSRVIVQKSLVEGFGLTVTEAMWKGRPVVASAVGGIQDQLTDGRDGLLVRDPSDLDLFADALARVLSDDDLAWQLGSAARQRVQDYFLSDRHLIQWVELFGLLPR